MGWMAYSFFLSAFCGFDFELDALAVGITLQYLGVEFELHALLF